MDTRWIECNTCIYLQMSRRLCHRVIKMNIVMNGMLRSTQVVYHKQPSNHPQSLCPGLTCTGILISSLVVAIYSIICYHATSAVYKAAWIEALDELSAWIEALDEFSAWIEALDEFSLITRASVPDYYDPSALKIQQHMLRRNITLNDPHFFAIQVLLCNPSIKMIFIWSWSINVFLRHDNLNIWQKLHSRSFEPIFIWSQRAQYTYSVPKKVDSSSNH